MACAKYGKTNVAGSIDRDSAVQGVLKFERKLWCQRFNVCCGSKENFRVLKHSLNVV
jgi:hypothetical protein